MRGQRKITLPHPEAKEVNMENRPNEAELQEAFDAADAANPPSDPPLPAGVASGTTKPSKQATNGGGAASEANENEANEEEELPAGQKSNSVAVARMKLYNKARDLGASKILGERSLLALAELALNGGADGLLDVSRNDADELYRRFRDPNSGLKKARFVSAEVNATSMSSNISKLEHFMELGTRFKQDGVKLFNTAHDVYKNMIADEQKRKSMKYTAAYEAVLSVVRSFMLHVKDEAKKKVTVTANEMPDAEAIEKALHKPDKDAKDAIAILAEAYNMIDKANEGREANGELQARTGLKDDRLNDALQTLRDVAADQGPDNEKRFLQLTTPKAKKAKKAEGGDTANGGDATAGNGEATDMDDQHDELVNAPTE